MQTYEVNRGDTAEFEVNVLDAEGQPMDITSCKIWFTGKLYPDDLDASALWSLNNEDDPTKVNVVDPITGNVVLVLTPDETQDLPYHRSLTFDVQLKDSASRVYTIQRGLIRVNPDITRAVV
jgi:hypothetical protein